MNFDKELKTAFGIDRLTLMLKLMPVLQADNEAKISSALNRFKSFLVEQIKRGIFPEEEIDLLEGCRQYIISDAGTNERMDAMNYLFDLKFLKEI